jgi:hypothetical protein
VRKFSILLSLGIILASVIPIFAQESTSGGIEPILIEITGVLTYEDVDNNGLREVVVDGVVVSPPAGFSSGDFQEGQLVTVAGYLLEDDTIEATSFMLAVEDVVATAEPTPMESDTSGDTEDQDDKAQDEQEREDEKREDEQEREDEKREDEREREEEKRKDEQEREDEKREDEREREDEKREDEREREEEKREDEREHEDEKREDNSAASESAEIPACIKESHPVVKTLAKEFATEVSTIIDLYCAGNGFGDITRALLLSAKTGETPETYLDKLNNGQDWGQIARDAGFEPSDVSPEGVLDGKG